MHVWSCLQSVTLSFRFLCPSDEWSLLNCDICWEQTHVKHVNDGYFKIHSVSRNACPVPIQKPKDSYRETWVQIMTTEKVCVSCSYKTLALSLRHRRTVFYYEKKNSCIIIVSQPFVSCLSWLKWCAIFLHNLSLPFQSEICPEKVENTILQTHVYKPFRIFMTSTILTVTLAGIIFLIAWSRSSGICHYESCVLS